MDAQRDTEGKANMFRNTGGIDGSTRSMRRMIYTDRLILPNFFSGNSMDKRKNSLLQIVLLSPLQNSP